MKPRIRLDYAETPDGKMLELFEHDGAHEIMLDKRALMTSRMHQSEEDLATIVCTDLPPRPRVMIGGMGIGFTLRTALDLLPENGRAIQVELMPQVIEWNRDLIGHHADHPVKDSRTKIVIGDVRNIIQRYQAHLHAIMLDVDNGPCPLVKPKNAWLYSHEGLKAIRAALAPGGKVAIWSAADDETFTKKLKNCGFHSERHVTHARPNRKGGRHYIFVGTRR